MRLATVTLACGLLVLTACNRKAEQAQPPAPAPAAPAAQAPTQAHLEVPAGFQHQGSFDASGYYLATQPVKVGAYRLTHVSIGAPSDFETWEAGDRASAYGPILFQFEDTSAPTPTPGSTPQPASAGVGVLPGAYGFAPGRVTFKGHDPKLGEVVFDGAFDEAALNAARNEGDSSKPVLRGKLKIGDEPVRDVALVYFVGE